MVPVGRSSTFLCRQPSVCGVQRHEEGSQSAIRCAPSSVERRPSAALFASVRPAAGLVRPVTLPVAVVPDDNGVTVEVSRGLSSVNVGSSTIDPRDDGHIRETLDRDLDDLSSITDATNTMTDTVSVATGGAPNLSPLDSTVNSTGNVGSSTINPRDDGRIRKTFDRLLAEVSFITDTANNFEDAVSVLTRGAHKLRLLDPIVNFVGTAANAGLILSKGWTPSPELPQNFDSKKIEAVSGALQNVAGVLRSSRPTLKQKLDEVDRNNEKVAKLTSEYEQAERAGADETDLQKKSKNWKMPRKSRFRRLWSG